MTSGIIQHSIRPIQTRYNEHLFRSRLEARWAVFMDALGVRWLYEPEGLVFDGELYLPDFVLPDLGYVLEIKPAINLSDWPEHPLFKPARAGETVNFPGFGELKFILIQGSPGVPDNSNDRVPYQGFVGYDDWYVWCECPFCGALGIQYSGRSARNEHRGDCRVAFAREHQECDFGFHPDKVYSYDSPRLTSAYRRASEARFEHGEQP